MEQITNYLEKGEPADIIFLNSAIIYRSRKCVVLNGKKSFL